MRCAWFLCLVLVSHVQSQTVIMGEYEVNPSAGSRAEESQVAAEMEGETTTSRVERSPISLPTGGVLYPRASESRDLKSLDGLWHFKLDSQAQEGIKERWFDQDISQMVDAILMPVPSSYNDITTLADVRDHVGLVWYQRRFFIPEFWKTQGQRVWLRFGSVHYRAQVWVNGQKVLEHEIGHLPFQGEISDVVNFYGENNVTVAVDNILGVDTIPQGSLKTIQTMKGPKTIQQYSFDFFNYAGIHRSVFLYTTPKAYIDDVLLTSGFQDDKVFVNYNLFYKGAPTKGMVNVSVAVISKEGERAVETAVIEDGPGNIAGAVEIHNPKLWWPYLMSPHPGYLYTVELTLTTDAGTTDIYRMPFGLRSLKWDNTSVYINDKPIYIRGFGRHEDSDIRGKGLDLPLALRDHNLLRWVGANAYRTSHYPYAEEIMDLAEQMGFMIIDEAPSVDTENFSQTLLDKHKLSLAELINRDKNRACVIMWSVANEPRTAEAQAGPYFGSVVSFTRTQDNTRPITAVLNRWYTVDKAGQWMDVICFNRYNAWYTEPGRWETIQLAVESEAIKWHEKHKKPVIMSEYGADTYEGLHNLPVYIWTEEFQQKVFSEHFKAFDNLRAKGWFIGEMIWNFADFKTDQSITRVGGNKKGVFTRQRQPKSSAFFVRRRNFKLAEEMDGASVPDDLELYSAPLHRSEL